MDRLFFWAAVTGFCSWGFLLFIGGFLGLNWLRDKRVEREKERAIQDRIDRGMF